MSNAITSAVILTKLTPKVDKSWKVEFMTQELGGKDIQVLGDLLGTEGYFAFSPNSEDIDNFQAPAEKADAGLGERKSLSERLYNTMFVYWKFIGEPDTFDIWRTKKMEQLINMYKEKLPEKKNGWQ